MFIAIRCLEFIERHRSPVESNKMNKFYLNILFVYTLILLTNTSPLSNDDNTQSIATKQADKLELALDSSLERDSSIETDSSLESESELESEAEAEAETSDDVSLLTPSSSSAAATSTTTSRSTTVRPSRPRPTRPSRPLVEAFTTHLTNMNTVFTALSSFMVTGLGSLSNLVGNLGGGSSSKNSGSNSVPGSPSGSLGLQKKIPIIEPAMDEIPILPALKDIPKLSDLNNIPDFNDDSDYYIYRLD